MARASAAEPEVRSRSLGGGGGCPAVRISTLSTSITAPTTPNYGAYAGHTAATEQYVRALAKELGPRGVTVNAVAPGPINSPFYFAVETEESIRAASRYSGANRLGEWDEIVPVIAFLTRPDAHWVTAQTIRHPGQRWHGRVALRLPVPGIAADVDDRPLQHRDGGDEVLLGDAHHPFDLQRPLQRGGAFEQRGSDL